ncbi:hypothetical protein BPAE_0268g00080 [Botrytis paeoniae]|uniref:Uncharacterized protein n=1 Tax=Botrytis paeoniae TaxID=278948 RepID=A0A4Z1F7I4_9HELO|nr:hypothetical protein BPAE_0268g00080 [Botrytis paeoniae]
MAPSSSSKGPEPTDYVKPLVLNGARIQHSCGCEADHDYDSDYDFEGDQEDQQRLQARRKKQAKKPRYSKMETKTKRNKEEFGLIDNGRKAVITREDDEEMARREERPKTIIPEGVPVPKRVSDPKKASGPKKATDPKKLPKHRHQNEIVRIFNMRVKIKDRVEENRKKKWRSDRD